VDLVKKIEELKVPNFRKKQLFHGIFKEFKSDFNTFTTLPKDLKQELNDLIPLRTLKPVKTLLSADRSTIKWSFLTEKGSPIETVLMLHDNGRNTLCISCQSGCPVNCSFCWTGAMGFLQNLSSWEIVEQILIANEWLRSNMPVSQYASSSEIKETQTVNRIVFMGMGEPMINLNAVTEAIDIIIHPDYFNLGQRSITVSTSGYIPMMRKFWAAYPKVGLAISLHAPTQELRAQLMPVAKQFSLDKLIEACDEIQKQTKRRATYEYILIDNVTDTEECAYALRDLLKNQLAHVNLIPYNPIEGRDFKRPSRNRVMKFCNLLKDLGVSATPRVTMGDDIKAACGQLSNHQ
jgi:23S rRNA (adenine2503-C2)-methyltransferase